MPYIQAYSFQLHIYITRFLWAYSQTSTIHSGAKCLPRVENSHIGWATSMPFASINYTNPRTNPWNFRKKISRIGDFEKRPFWKIGHFEFFFLQKKIFFCFILMKISPNLYGRMDGSKFWRFPWFPGNFLLCVI